MPNNPIRAIVGVSVLTLLLIWLIANLPIFYPNMGGNGLALPQNILAWGVMTLVIIIIALAAGLMRTGLVFTSTSRLLFIGITLLSLPLLYTRPEWQEGALWRCAGLFGGWVFYVACLQVVLTPRQRTLILYALLCAVSVQALLALLQLFVPSLAWVAPNGGRVYGVFQQPNVLASFIATGLALALLLQLSPIVKSTRRTQAVLIFLTALFSALLVWIQSRAGLLGGMLAAILLLYRYGRHRPVVARFAAGSIAIGATIGFAVLSVGLVVGEKAGFILRTHSNNARLSMLQDTVAMILAKPLTGWGYGGFEYSFLHFRLNTLPWREVSEVASHPHNEILLWWVEGGLTALLGIVVILTAGGLLLRQAVRQERNQPDGTRIGLFLVMLPMLVHSQLEYPFYQSIPHWLVFLLLLALLDRETNALRPLPAARTISLPIALAATGVLVLAIYAWAGQMALTKAERTRLTNIGSIEAMSGPATWIHRERKVFDEKTYALLVYNQTKDEALLTAYRQWADDYLQRRIDANVYATLIMILRYQGEQAKSDARLHEASFFFPQDPRFK